MYTLTWEYHKYWQDKLAQLNNLTKVLTKCEYKSYTARFIGHRFKVNWRCTNQSKDRVHHHMSTLCLLSAANHEALPGSCETKASC